MLLIDWRRAARVSALALVLSAPAAARAGDDEPLSITREGGLFTITVTEPSPVEDVLTELADDLGAELEGAEETGEVGPLKLVRVSLHQALREILQKQSFALKYEQGSSDPTLIRIAGRKSVTEVGEAPEEAAPPDAIPDNPQDVLSRLFKGKLPQPNGVPNQDLGGLLNANPQIKLLQACGALLKLPQNKGKKSETLVTPEGQACPPGIKVFGG